MLPKRRLLLNIGVAVLLVLNVIAIFRNGVTILNMMAILLCVVCLALNFTVRSGRK